MKKTSFEGDITFYNDNSIRHRVGMYATKYKNDGSEFYLFNGRYHRVNGANSKMFYFLYEFQIEMNIGRLVI